MQWWLWIAAGFILCICELMVPAFVLIWLGISALFLGVLTLFVPMPLVLQLLIWVILSSGLVFLWLKFFREQDHSRAGRSDEAVGEVGLLVKSVMPYQPGEVLFQRPIMGTDRWICVADENISSGKRVKVTNVEGHVLRVALAQEVPA